MHVLAAAAWLITEAPTPLPVPDSQVPDNLVSPGILGFITIALIAVAAILLIIDMTRRVRRVRYREEIRERLEAEQAEAERAAADRAGVDGQP